MDGLGCLLEEHRALTRRYFVPLGAAGVTALACSPLPPIPSQFDAPGAAVDLADAARRRTLGGPAHGSVGGEYDLCCRTIDADGVAQPLPRPLPKSGRNEIQRIRVTVEA